MTLQTYGHDGTIHDSEYVDVEVDNTGKVVAVWFRCMSLPFRQSIADDFRADQMRDHHSKIRLKAVQYDDGLIDTWAGPAHALNQEARTPGFWARARAKMKSIVKNKSAPCGIP